MSSQTPKFDSPEFLLDHMRQIMEFYYPICLNRDDGGYYNEYRDDGFITDRVNQHLVSTTRFIFNFSLASGIFERTDYAEAAQHGLSYLTDIQRDKEHGGYFWEMAKGEPRSDEKQCYGHAFVLLAYATAHKAGIGDMSARISELWDLLEARFWLPEGRLYADEFTRDWQPLSDYRGQNCNMHMCEAMLTAFEATGDERYLDRAETIAERICVDLAAQAGEIVWEHYTKDFNVDWHYNKDDPLHLFRPYGYLPGHMTEWTKLLLILERYRPKDWMLPRARRLYEIALARSADLANGGMHYTFGPDGRTYNRDKYHWVHCETIAAAACLAVRTGEERFWQDYELLWQFSWRHMIDRERGGWYRICSPEGKPLSDIKSPAAKTDYHPFGACYEVLRITGHIEG